MFKFNLLEHIIGMLYYKYFIHIIVHFQNILFGKKFLWKNFNIIKNKDIVGDPNVKS